MPRGGNGAVSPLGVYGAMLRHYRTRAGLSRDQLGAMVFLTGDMIGKIESGQRAPSEQLTKACEDIPELSCNGALTELREVLRDHLRNRAYPGWFADWPQKEARASRLRAFALVVVPGLLQTEDYARAVLSTKVGATADEVEEMVAARLERQDVLRRDKPPEYWVLIDEAVLRRPVGGADVMRRQLESLASAATLPHVVFQVVPLSAGAHQGLNGGPFVIADFEGAPSVAYQDTPVSGQVTEAADEVEALARIWDTVRTEALPRAASLELVEEVTRQWT